MTNEPPGEPQYEELKPPAPVPPRRGRELLTGLDLLPEQRLAAFSDTQLEMVVEHWLFETAKGQYEHIVEYGGAGDLGRDRVGFVGEIGSDPWDNFQCKQYGKKLAPSDLWTELGKLAYHIVKGNLSVPRRYFLVAPLGIGPKALDLLGDPEAIRTGLTAHWDKYCEDLCPLAEIEEELKDVPLPAFEPVTAGTIVEGLKDAPIYPVLFGGGLTKPRPTDMDPPEEILDSEIQYVGRLVEAYDDHCNDPVTSADDALAHGRYGSHLKESRRDFYRAESLREFSKDVFIEGDTYESLKDLVFDGIKYTVQRSHPTGFDRVLETCEQAATVQLGDHPLAGETNPADRSGICHQLANEDRVRWVQ